MQQEQQMCTQIKANELCLRKGSSLQANETQKK